MGRYPKHSGVKIKFMMFQTVSSSCDHVAVEPFLHCAAPFLNMSVTMINLFLPNLLCYLFLSVF